MVCQMPANNRRCRRRRQSIHTTHQIACILLFDLLFSQRRQQYEKQRLSIFHDISRRQGLKVCRESARARKFLRLQDIVDIYDSNRERLRSVEHFKQYPTAGDRQAVCIKYADVVYHVWNAFAGKMSRRVTFDAAAAALLYHMRRGLALDGMHVVPMDPFLFQALPGKSPPNRRVFFVRCSQL